MCWSISIAVVEEYKYLGHAVEAHGQCRRMVEG